MAVAAPLDDQADTTTLADPGESGDTDDSGESVHPLLEVQLLDIEAEQLRHSRTNLSQRRDLAAALAERADISSRLDMLGAQRLEVLSKQKRLEDEAATVQARADVDDNRLYSGELTAIRDLQALQDEIAGLRSRQGLLEERAIEALLEAEDLAEQANELEAQRGVCDERVTVLEAELAAAEASIDAQLAAVSASRGEAADRADAEAVASYERLRDSFGPSTAVSFDPSTGCGCPQQMPAVEVARIKRCAAGEVLDCAECGRLVLR